MAQVSIDVVVDSSGAITGLRTTKAAFDGVSQAVMKQQASLVKLASSTDTLTSAQQKAVMRLEAMHDAALQMNTGLAATSDKSEMLGRNLNALQGAVSTTASAFGVSASALGPMNAAVDVASMGFDKLKTSAVGFNVASMAVVGAGLAVGAAIGGWLRTFPAVAKAADDAAAALWRLATSQKELDKQAAATSGLSKWQAEMAAANEKAQAKQVATLRAAGMAEQQILDILKGKHEEKVSSVVAGLEKQIAADKKAAEEAKRNGIEQAKAAEAGAKAFAKMREAQFDAFNALKLTSAELELHTIQYDEYTTVQHRANEYIVDFVDGVEKSVDAMEKWRRETIEAQEALERLKLEEMADGFDQVGSVLADVDGLMDSMGVSAESMGRRLLQAFSQAAQGAADFFAGMASGNPAQMISGVIGVGQALFGFLGASSRAREEMMRTANEIRNMRNEFIESRGGIDILRQEAERAGVSLTAMFNAKTVEQYQDAVERVQEQLDLFEEGTRLTAEALERWKIPIEATSAAFQQARLHEGLAELYRDLELMATAGVDFKTVMESEMGPALQTMVQNALNAGQQLPEFMRPWIEKMIEAEMLLDANGNLITDISQLPFTESLEAGVARLVTQIERLVNALLGIPQSVNTQVNVHTNHTSGGGGGGHFQDPNDLDNNPDTPMAEGGYIPPRRGGTRVIAAEAGEGEFFVPESKVGSFVRQMGGGGGDINLTIPVSIGGEKLDTIIVRRQGAGFHVARG